MGSAVAVPAATVEAHGGAGLGPFQRWAAGHEQSWLFTILYVGLAITLSFFLSLFWLVVLVLLHLWLEWVAAAPLAQHRWRRLQAALWEVKLDAALLLLALVLTLYLEHIFGLLGLRGATQVAAGARAAGRFATLERTVRGILLSLDDAAYVARAVLARKPKAQRARELAARHEALGVTPVQAPRLRWRHWSTGDRVALGLLAAGLALLAATPALTDHTITSAWATAVDNFRPVP